MPVPISPACAHLSFLPLGPRGASALPQEKISSLCAPCRLGESRVLKHAGKRGKPPEFTKAAFTLVQKLNGPFLMGEGGGMEQVCQKACLLPSYTYSIFPWLVLSRQEHTVAIWKAGRGGNLVQNKPMYKCVCELKLKPRSPLPTHFIGDHTCNKPVSENEGSLFLFEEIALHLGLCCLMTNPWRCHWQKQLRRSPGKTCPSSHEQHRGMNASNFLLPMEPSCSAPVSKSKGLK